MIYCYRNASVNFLTPASGGGQSLQTVNCEFNDNTSHLCAVKFFGTYARFYMIDKW